MKEKRGINLIIKNYRKKPYKKALILKNNYKNILEKKK